MRLKLIAVLVCMITIVHVHAQEWDTIAPIRDNIGDLNATAIRLGEFPGAIKLPGSDISVSIGGFLKAVALYDSKYNEKNEIIFPGTFSENNIYQGQSYVGARSSRLFLDVRTTLENIKVRGYYEIDFRGSNGFTLRHAYLSIRNRKGQSLLMGQYWSLIMDLQGTPEGLVEPTMSGGTFARHGQIRFTTPLSKKITFAASLEDPSSNDFKGINMVPVNKYFDVLASLSVDPNPIVHFSAVGLYRPLTFNDDTSDKLNTKSGWLSSFTTVVKPSASDKFSLVGMYGSGAAGYIMGGDGTAGYFDGENMELQMEYGGFCSYQHVWNKKFRSNAAIGIFNANEIKNNPNPHIKSSTYGFINTYYHLNKYVNIGVEWVYSAKENYHGGSFNNNRFQFGVQVF